MEDQSLHPLPGFFLGKSLPDELRRVMDRIAARGIAYPPGYYETLLEKYTKNGVRYPHILMILGRPRISGHFLYPQVLSRPGRLLDYGCGTGDNVRKLIRDGFPKDRITAFDINNESTSMGFDLYRDENEIGGLFVIAPAFPFRPGSFDMLYSASVIHVIDAETEFLQYLANAYSALVPGGIFFGSTLGLNDHIVRSAKARGPPRLLTIEQLKKYLTGAGFSRPTIVRKGTVPEYVPGSEELCFLEFSAER